LDVVLEDYDDRYQENDYHHYDYNAHNYDSNYHHQEHDHDYAHDYDYREDDCTNAYSCDDNDPINTDDGPNNHCRLDCVRWSTKDANC
ncbi:hypothetical protein AAVH_35074, partial [Aphelenchoides avenae]